VASTLATMLIYGAILVAALARIAAPLLPAIYYQALLVAGIGWLAAFALFLRVYGSNARASEADKLKCAIRAYAISDNTPFSLPTSQALRENVKSGTFCILWRSPRARDRRVETASGS
jgi:hypothetical protein